MSQLWPFYRGHLHRLSVYSSPVATTRQLATKDRHHLLLASNRSITHPWLYSSSPGKSYDHILFNGSRSITNPWLWRANWRQNIIIISPLPAIKGKSSPGTCRDKSRHHFNGTISYFASWDTFDFYVIRSTRSGELENAITLLLGRGTSLMWPSQRSWSQPYWPYAASCWRWPGRIGWLAFAASQIGTPGLALSFI